MLEKKIVYNIKNGVLYIDVDYNILQSSKYAAELGGYKEPNQIIGQKCYNAFFGLDKPCYGCPAALAISSKTYFSNEKMLMNNGKYYSIRVMPDFDKDGNVIGIIETFDDVTSKIKEENSLKKIAYFDELTNLHNRNALYRMIDKKKESKWALILIDLDDFRSINDKSGYDFGDKFLKAFSQKLSEEIGNKGTIGRLGGDEFLIILDCDREETEVIIKKLYKKLEDPIEFEWNNIFISCSMGIALYPDDANNRSKLLKYADLALYQSKQLGKKTYTFYSDEIRKKFNRKQTIIETLREAIRNDKSVEIYYQPIVDIKTGKVKKIEALSRLENEKLKDISISEFICIAEETGLIIELGDIIFERVCGDIYDWNERGYKNFDVSINLSIVQLKNKNLINRILLLTNKYKIDRSRISLEITETAFLDNLDVIKEPLSKLSELGYSFSVDDLGSGYSSIDYIVNLPIDIIKIDKDYINRINEDNVIAFLKTIRYFAFLTNKTIIIEGVEIKEQYQKLEEMGFNYIQGYYFYKPMNKREIEKILS